MAVVARARNVSRITAVVSAAQPERSAPPRSGEHVLPACHPDADDVPGCASGPLGRLRWVIGELREIVHDGRIARPDAVAVVPTGDADAKLLPRARTGGASVSVDRQQTETLGRRLEWATIAWNSIEVFVTIGLGIAAGSLALIAFGLDSLVEVFASVVVIWHMTPGEGGHHAGRDGRALRLVSVAFAVLSAYLLVAGIRQLALHERPDASVPGIAYLFVTALVMFGLARWKHRVAATLESDPFRAEASMTFLDGCLATSILTALAVNLLFGWWWADPGAALLIAIAAAREARDGWREARELETAIP